LLALALVLAAARVEAGRKARIFFPPDAIWGLPFFRNAKYFSLYENKYSSYLAVSIPFFVARELFGGAGRWRRDIAGQDA
jgi:hypothetical protein